MFNLLRVHRRTTGFVKVYLNLLRVHSRTTGCVPHVLLSRSALTTVNSRLHIHHHSFSFSTSFYGT